MSNKISSTGSGGIGFFGMLTIVFIVLKLTGQISWSWIWVLSPLWIPFIAVFFMFLGIYLLIDNICE